LEFVFAKKGDTGSAGASGTQTGTAFLYQWSTATPSNPSGTSSFVWATATNQTYTGGGGWTTTIPANPGTAGIKLWQASKGVSDVATATSTTVDWTSGYAVKDITQNGAAGASGTQSASAIVYQWAASIPSGPTGTSTYTWSSGTFTPTPSGWTLSPGSSTAGFTLWQARVQLVDSATVSTTTINWSTAAISAAGYAGTNGTNGATGANGSSARVMYARISGNPTPIPGTVTVSGDNYPSSGQSSAVWGGSFAVTWYGSDPSPTSNNSLYQADGVYNPSTNQTVWSAPYISSLKVGSLSAITTNTGDLNVTGTIQSGTAAISGSSMSGSGAVIYSGGNFAIGNSSRNLSFNGSTLTMNGDLIVTGNLQSNSISSLQYVSGISTILSPNTADGTIASLNWTTPVIPGTSGNLLAQVIFFTDIYHQSTGSSKRVQIYPGITVNGVFVFGNPMNLYLNNAVAIQSVDNYSDYPFSMTQSIEVPQGASCNSTLFYSTRSADTGLQAITTSISVVLFKR
jgi:hypothetical protein